MWKFFRSPMVVAVLLGACVSLGVLAARGIGILEFLELAAYDWGLRLRTEATGSDSRIVFVGVTEEDIRNQGRWPLTDATLARALKVLTEARPRAIGLDIYRDIEVPPGRDDLNAILSGNSHIIAVTKFGDRGVPGIPPPPILRKTDQVGVNDLLIDPDGIIRRGLLFLDDEEGVAPSFALRLALLYLKEEGITPQPDHANPQHLRLGPTTLRPLEANDGAYAGADARGYQILLDFRGARSPFSFISLTSLLSGQVDPGTFRDKIVLVGVMAESVHDFFHTPTGSGLQLERATFGTVVHAHIVSQLLRAGLEGHRPMATPTDKQEAAWILLWAMLGAALGLWVRSPWNFALLATCGLVVLALTVYAAFLSGWWITLAPPALAWLISAALVTAYMSNQEKHQRAVLMQLFSRHVSPEVADIIWQQRDQFLDGGRLRSQKLTATVLFVDLKGFTSVAEKMDPQALMDWLNTCIDTMAQQVIAHGGVIDDYAGDSIKVNFGVPLARKTEAEIQRDAISAVNCALAMEEALTRLNARLEEQNLPHIGMRIGIYTGPVVAGSLGSAQRLKFTTVGDTVNTASRLESLDKDVGDPGYSSDPCRILIGESTWRCLDRQFHTQLVSQISLKGKDEKITVYRVLGRKEPVAHDGIQGEKTMKNVKKAAVVTLVGLLLGALASGDAPADQQGKPTQPTVEAPNKKPPPTASMLVYNPPKRGAPGGRVGGGTRGTDQSFTLSVLAPSHTGLTVNDQPILHWFLSKAITSPVELTLIDERGVKPILETRLTPPFPPGVHRVKLADHNVRLSQGKYQWFVALVVDPERRSRDILAGGSIELVDPSQGISAKLSQIGMANAPQIYAEAGLWYDAVTAISDQIEAAPSDINLRKQRASLLQQAGLTDVAEYDLSAGTAGR